LMKLAPMVYDAELHQMLEELDAKFVSWRRGDLAGGLLHQAIHEYHQNDARSLWSVHRILKRDQVVARGVALGFIKDEQLSSGLHAKLASSIDWYKEMKEREDEPLEYDDEDDEE